MEVLKLETDELRLLYLNIGIELENRDMKRTRLIDVSHNIIFRDGFQRYLPDKVIHVIRNNILCKWEEIFKILDWYEIDNMIWNAYKNRIELKFKPYNKYERYHKMMDKKEEIIEAIEKLF